MTERKVSSERAYRHKKRGTQYVLIGIGRMQAEDWWTRQVDHHGRASAAGVDMREVAIYSSVTDPTEIWVRPREEFEDGRFEALPDAAPAAIEAPAAQGEAVAGKGEQRTICDACGNSNLAHDRAVWTDDGSAFCPGCAPSPAAASVVTEEMVERGARAIVSSLWDAGGGGVIAVDLWQSKEDCVDAKWQHWGPEARSALSAALKGDR